MEKIGIEARLQHWAGWTLSFEDGRQGWPEESPLHRFQIEGFISNENKTRSSSLPYKHNKYAEGVNSLFLTLKTDCFPHAEAVYVYYVSKLNVNEFSRVAKIHPSTFYKRLRAAKRWLAERLAD